MHAEKNLLRFACVILFSQSNYVIFPARAIIVEGKHLIRPSNPWTMTSHPILFLPATILYTGAKQLWYWPNQDWHYYFPTYDQHHLKCLTSPLPLCASKEQSQTRKLHLIHPNLVSSITMRLRFFFMNQLNGHSLERSLLQAQNSQSLNPSDNPKGSQPAHWP